MNVVDSLRGPAFIRWHEFHERAQRLKNDGLLKARAFAVPEAHLLVLPAARCLVVIDRGELVVFTVEQLGNALNEGCLQGIFAFVREKFLHAAPERDILAKSRRGNAHVVGKRAVERHFLAFGLVPLLGHLQMLLTDRPRVAEGHLHVKHIAL